MTTPLTAQYLRGVNLSQGEFGGQNIPGTYNRDYTFGTETTFRYFGAKSLSLFRIATLWERLQPKLQGPLDPTYLGYLKQNVTWARAHGGKVILEPHNFGRYSITVNGVLTAYAIDNLYGGVIKVSRADFADFWVRLSNEFRDEPAVYAYGLMNEPHDMGAGNWNAISQAALSAIRGNGDNKLITIPGNSYQNADLWRSVNGASSWIIDPAQNFVYEAHLYFDRDYSGTYAHTYDEELAQFPNLPMLGAVRVQNFLNWCAANKVRGYLGEYGIPNSDARWQVVLDNFLKVIDGVGMDGTYWAAGEWWGNYPLSVQPLDNFNTDRPQLSVLQGHLAPASFTTASAASYGWRTAPDSLVTGFGTNLSPTLAIQLTDSVGTQRAAERFSITPTQVSYLIPADLVPGHVDVVVTDAGAVIGKGSLELYAVAPALFSANYSGSGVAGAYVQIIHADGTQDVREVFRYDEVAKVYISVPIDLGPVTDRVFLNLYGTGFRKAASTRLQINNTTVPLQFAGKQSLYAGLDQAVAELPRSLMGAGSVGVVLTADSVTANLVSLTFQ